MGKIKKWFKIETEAERKIIMFTFLLFSVLLIGAGLNWLVTTSNGMKMPVKTYSNIDDACHFSFVEEKIKFSGLSDIFYLNAFDYSIWYSIGDVLIIFSTLLMSLILVMQIYKSVRIKWQR